MTEGLLTPAGHPTALRQWGEGDRQVLALHCSLAHAGAWSGLAAELPGCRITAPDLPGHGRSADWTGAPDLHDLTTAVVADLAAGLGGAVDLVGHSFGATVALRLALEQPGLIRSLTLIEPVLFAAALQADAPEWQDFVAGYQGVQDHIGQDDRLAARDFHGRWGIGAFDRLPPVQQDYMIARMPLVRGQSPVLLEDAARMLVPGRLEALDRPVLLIDGADSPPIIGAIHRALAARLPRVSRFTVPGAGHMVPITHSSLVAMQLRAHLSTT
ncbi:alpha/beta fold hydrolase [Gemmobacter denitrificans]|uniref:Alpha/beta hydrolase n=1 Tax=Gemmobacter denitrificans TaxID=3123040 RepID=A0ABU8BWE9_9RHOB